VDEGGGASQVPPVVDCADAVHQLYDYLDGELTEERRKAIALHLDLCGSCGEAAEFEQELRMVIANCCRDRVPESLKARIADALHLEAARQAGAAGDRDPAAP
jgi:mycothiol system anti-sigma-R factor